MSQVSSLSPLSESHLELKSHLVTVQPTREAFYRLNVKRQDGD